MMRGKEKKEEKKDEGKEGERRGEKCPGALLVSGLQLPPPPFPLLPSYIFSAATPSMGSMTNATCKCSSTELKFLLYRY